jgi:hypothetical protein
MEKKFTDFERRQIAAVRADLEIDTLTHPSASKSTAGFSSSSRT